MKRFIFLVIISLVFNSCSSDSETSKERFEFIVEYSAQVTVGGVIGITERTFAIGEVYTGTDNGDGTVTIRIAEHSELNNDCPNSWCYQELLEVPVEYLKLID